MRPVTYWVVKNGLSATLLIFFGLHVAVPQDNARRHFITTELMDWLCLPSGSPQRFAIKSQVRVIGLPRRRLQTAGFLSRLGFALPIARRRRTGSRRGACHPLSLAHCNRSSGTAWSFGAVQSARKDERHDAESTLLLRSNSFVLPVWPGRAGRGSAPIRSVSLVHAADQAAFVRLGRAKPRQPLRGPFPKLLGCSMLYSPRRVLLVGFVFVEFYKENSSFSPPCLELESPVLEVKMGESRTSEEGVFALFRGGFMSPLSGAM